MGDSIGIGPGARDSEPSRRHITAFRCDDLEQITELVGQDLIPHRMTVRSSGRVEMALRRFDLGRAHLVDIAYGTSVEIEPDQDRDHYMVHASLAGESLFETATGTYTLAPDRLLVTSPGQARRITLSPRCRHITLRFSWAELRRRLVMLGMPVPDAPLLFHPEIGAESGFPLMWRQLLDCAVPRTDDLGPLGGQVRIQEQYVAFLLDILVSQAHGSGLVRPGEAPAPLPRHVRRACRIMEEHFADDISVDRLADEVGVSTRSLQNGFRTFVRSSPAEYLRNVRMQRLHVALRRAAPHAKITSLMLDCGISNFGRYAQYYRDTFGYLPSETPRDLARP
ncbi:MAG TPA: AraC family transcriptional regulator [Sphingomonas sp.]